MHSTSSVVTLETWTLQQLLHFIPNLQQNRPLPLQSEIGSLSGDLGATNALNISNLNISISNVVLLTTRPSILSSDCPMKYAHSSEIDERASCRYKPE